MGSITQVETFPRSSKGLPMIANGVAYSSFIVFVPPVSGRMPEVLPRYPIPSDSYNYTQMVDVLAIFDKRWRSAGSPEGREPYATRSIRNNAVHEPLDPLDILTSSGIQAKAASEAYIQAVYEKESANKLLRGLLSVDEEEEEADY